MRFEIKDLLFLTLIAAIAAVGVRGHYQTRDIQQEAFNTLVHANQANSQTAALKNKAVNASAQSDFYAEVSKAYNPAIAGFADFQKRYGAVEPKPNLVSIRSVPEIRTAKNHSIMHFRISVPDMAPVFLRSAIADASPSMAISKKRLDEQEWTETPTLSESHKSQTRLTPGIHDLTITIYRTLKVKPAKIELELDGQRLMKTTCTNLERSFGSWSGINPPTQYDFDFRNGTKYLAAIDIDNAKSRAELKFWIWLSGDNNADGFQDHSLVDSGVIR